MKNDMRRLFITIVILISVMLCSLSFVNSNFAKASSIGVTTNNTGISIDPDGPLLNLSNMAPGDTKSSNITVRSNFKTAFSILISSAMEAGEEILFRNLIISVKNHDDTYTYYNGPLNNLKNIKLDSTKPSEDNRYIISVLFPTSCGNEFQGKTMVAKLIFSTQAVDNAVVVSKDNPIIPLTGDISIAIVVVLFSLSLLLTLIAKKYKYK